MKKYDGKLVQRSQLINIIADKLGIARKRIEQILKLEEELIIQFMEEGRYVALNGFVCFKTKITNKGPIANGSYERLYPVIEPNKELILKLRDVPIPDLARKKFKSVIRWHPELKDEYKN